MKRSGKVNIYRHLYSLCPNAQNGTLIVPLFLRDTARYATHTPAASSPSFTCTTVLLYTIQMVFHSQIRKPLNSLSLRISQYLFSCIWPWSIPGHDNCSPLSSQPSLAFHSSGNLHNILYFNYLHLHLSVSSHNHCLGLVRNYNLHGWGSLLS